MAGIAAEVDLRWRKRCRAWIDAGYLNGGRGRAITYLQTCIIGFQFALGVH